MKRGGPTLSRYYYIKDHLGSIRSTINTSNVIVGRDDYDPWGMILEGRSYVSSADARFGYISKERDAETGNYWLDVRPYVPGIGRFLTPDPLMDQAPLSSWSPYHYSYNNPILYKDPDGEHPLIYLAIAAVITAMNPEIANAPGPQDPVYPANHQVGALADATGVSLGRMIKIATSGGSVLNSADDIIRTNKSIGKAFEEQTHNVLKQTDKNVAREVTVKTPQGTKTRIDHVSTDASTGKIKLTESKSSSTAPLTKNQKKAFPELESSGGQVVGKGKPGYPGGAKVPPTKVKVIRPEDLK